MGPNRQLSLACWLCCLLLASTVAAADSERVLDTVDKIQLAIDNAQEYATIYLPGGVIDMGSAFLRIDKILYLRTRFFSNVTIFRTSEDIAFVQNKSCNTDTEVQAMVQVCNREPSRAGNAIGGNLNSHTKQLSSSTLIAGIKFERNGEQKGAGRAMRWEVYANSFQGTKRGLWVHSNSDITIEYNDFTGFHIGVGNDEDDTASSLTIKYNTFKGLIDQQLATCQAASGHQRTPSCEATAVSLSAAIPPQRVTPHFSSMASPPSAMGHVLRDDTKTLSRHSAINEHKRGHVVQPLKRQINRDWDINNNLISSVTTGIEFSFVESLVPPAQVPPNMHQRAPNSKIDRRPTATRKEAPSGLEGVDASVNSITIAVGCAGFAINCFAVVNRSPYPASALSNWFGSSEPQVVASLINPVHGANAVTYDPFITSYTPGNCSFYPTVGFCPVDYTLHGDQPPKPLAILAMTVNPSTTTPGSAFIVSVTVEPAVAGSLTVSSEPAGVICPPLVIDTPTTTFMVACTAPSQAGASAFSTTSLEETEANVPLAEADQLAALHGHGSGGPVNPIKPTTAPTAAVGGAYTSYVLTATVSAEEQTATKSAELRVTKPCQSLPWPFLAHVRGCEKCGFDCTTNTFSCQSCPCQCPYKPDSYRDYESDSRRDHKISRYRGDEESRYTRDPYHQDHGRPTEVHEERPYYHHYRQPEYDARHTADNHDDAPSHYFKKPALANRNGYAEIASHSMGYDTHDIPASLAEVQFAAYPRPYDHVHQVCPCGPAPLVITPLCKVVNYDGKQNKFRCSISGVY